MSDYLFIAPYEARDLHTINAPMTSTDFIIDRVSYPAKCFYDDNEIFKEKYPDPEEKSSLEIVIIFSKWKTNYI